MKIDKLSDVQFNHLLEVLIHYKKCNPDNDVYLNENSIKEAIQFFMKNGILEDFQKLNINNESDNESIGLK